ncbi:hypothetical protein AB1303_13890 [Saccharolobus solfataricus]|uniref:Uncharacterized protein n=2 Tax=Saccharolobus solfataricus TaxID=2287 RepID=Q97ZN8_SACS2|nr:hypothetical protein [Saccharolobus solfataricus]AAK41140.1 Hypothetical protein SSO0846 [Saccharolobus solfataricus P2]QPG49177.1 hypothetical protein HFC64_04235 [Saccharolobus solfataricus]SAI84445.1 uncharacterised protein [Saccharolobus solfataricus]
MIDLCVVKCDENEVKKKSKEIVEGLKEIYDNFNDSLIKEIRVEESVFGIRGSYNYNSKILTLYCINCVICVETIVHEIIHSNSYKRARDMYFEGLTEFLTLYYLKKRVRACLDHRFIDEICRINKEYEIYATFWGNLALIIGIKELWKYYSKGYNHNNIDNLVKNDIYKASFELAKRYNTKLMDLIDVIEKLE